MARVLGKWSGIFALALIAALAGASVAGLGLRHLGQAMNGDIGKIVSPNGIDEAGYMTIGGVRQWVTVRGQDRSRPVLLFLHGGPGTALADEAYIFQRPWEDYFTVVEWDQRGFGRSDVDAARIKGTVTNDRMVADAIDLIEQLRVRLHQPKIIVVGQSWGTILGLQVARKRPDLLHALVTIGLSSGWERNFEETRRLLIDLARRTGDRALLKKMTDAGPAPPATDWQRFSKWGLTVQPEMTNRGYTWHNSMGPPIVPFIGAGVFSPSLGDGDLLKTFLPHPDRDAYSVQIAGSLSGWTPEKDVGIRLDVPWVAMQGDWDWQTPTTTARAYFDKVCAPWKLWVPFHNSAHIVTAEEPGKTVVTLVNDVLPAVTGQIPAGAETCRGRPGSAYP